MKNLYKGLSISLCLIVAVINTSEQTSIEPYNHNRDFVAVQQILDTNQNYLRYENMGFPQGTTEQYIESHNFSTDVLRINNQTVGFVSYYMEHLTLLTFYIHSAGCIHLLGIDFEHQGKGYGKKLMLHAIEKMKQNNMASASLAVKKSNTKAQKLYESCGFTIAISLDDDFYYKKNLDVLEDKLPQGNIIQRNKKISTAIASLAIAGLVSWNYLL